MDRFPEVVFNNLVAANASFRKYIEYHYG
jgi:hypothetical protein